MLQTEMALIQFHNIIVNGHWRRELEKWNGINTEKLNMSNKFLLKTSTKITLNERRGDLPKLQQHLKIVAQAAALL